MRNRFVVVCAAMALALASYAGKNALVRAGQAKLSAYGQIDRKRLLAADQHPEDWLTTGRDFGKGHYSPLAQVNRETVSRLGLAWDYHTHTDRGLEATPIVVDGVMYTSGVAGRVYALDGKTGKELWTFDPQNDLSVTRRSCCDEVNRGVAVWKGKVYTASLDGRLFALDAATGAVLWKVDTVVDHQRGYTSTGAPEIAGRVVAIGNGGAEYDARGYVSAYDLDTGKFAWRFFTVPGSASGPYENPELEVAAKTWDPKSRWDMGGGGTVWDGMVYDPELNLLYFGTGNGTFFDQSKRSPAGGDNLFIASILAINPDTGRLVWHYQEVPGEQWDYDVVQPLVLTDLKIGGSIRKVMMQASKDGFFYIFDRKTGQLLSAEKFVPVTWADHIDLKTGRPVEAANARDFRNSFNGKKYVEPSVMGGHNWHAMAWDAQRGLMYIPEIENGQTGIFSGKAILRAWDPIRSKHVWELEPTDWWDRAGVLATAGGLVFQGNGTGHFCAYDAATGKKLKDIDVGTTIMAAPMTYSVDGVQYVAVMAAWGGGGWSMAHPASAAYIYGNEGRLLVFKLDGGPTPKPEPLPPLGPIPQPPALTASPEAVNHGKDLFAANCSRCHTNDERSLALNLRRMPPEIHEAFQQVVLGGMLKNAGMPPWEGVLSPKEVADIHAYLISISWDAYKAQQAAKP
ncbi:MAG: PQQ-dependent dehydrogenase, methanol/ethanol family [Acidobacteriia bacterium]|nr:PQQ-dependent dehydrogenase, methanol/ethanol family [Terriglobia bacterium]